MADTCKTCRFQDNGWCRRFPPVLFPEDRRDSYSSYQVNVWTWPGVSDESWCGEHKPKEET